MKLDALLVRALIHEVGALITGSRVEKVYQPDSATVQIRLFPPRDAFLTFSAAATRPHFVLLGEKLPQPPAPLRFCQLLRSRLEGGGVESIEQVGSDRIVRVVFRRRETEGDAPAVDHRYELVSELFGPHADIYLGDLDEKRTLGHLKNGPAHERFADGYVPPEAHDRPSAFGMEAAALEPYIARALTGEIALFRELDRVPPGLAKLTLALARELDVPRAAAALAGHLKPVEQHVYAPRVIEDGRGGQEVLLAAYEPLPSGWTSKEYDSVAELARRVMVEDVRTGELESRRAGVAKTLREMRTREEERRRHTSENLERANKADEQEMFGNLIKGQLKLVEPYRESVELVNYYDVSGGMIRVPLKKNLSPKANADRYFLKAKKLRASVGQLEQRLAEHEDNLERIDLIEEHLKTVVDRNAMEDIEREVRTVGRVSSGKPGKEKGKGLGPLEFVSTAGYRILVGRSSRENDMLTRKMARPHDMWLHAKGLAGAHVVVRMANADAQCPPGTLEEAAQLAAHYSKGRYAAKVEVLVTRAGKVKKPQGLAPGQVLVEGAGSMMVRTDSQAPARLARPL